MGFTAPSRFLVRKSQNILGQKKPSTEAAIWSMDYVSRDIAREISRDVQTDAVKTMSRAQ